MGHKELLKLEKEKYIALREVLFPFLFIFVCTCSTASECWSYCGDSKVCLENRKESKKLRHGH